MATTEITPSPPTEICGNVKASSPEITKKFSGLLEIMVIICSKFPEASLIPIILVKSLANLNVVSEDILELVLPGTLYKIIGRLEDKRISLKC